MKCDYGSRFLFGQYLDKFDQIDKVKMMKSYLTVRCKGCERLSAFEYRKFLSILREIDFIKASFVDLQDTLMTAKFLTYSQRIKIIFKTILTL